MIVFQGELPLDHSRSLTYLAKKWAMDIYAYDEGTARIFYKTDSNYYLETAWRSIGEHLWAEGLKVNVPVGDTYSSLRLTTLTFGGDYV